MYVSVFGPEPVGTILKRRGFTIAARGNITDVLLPLRREPPLSGEQVNEFRKLFSKSTFRKLVRQLLLSTPGADVEQLSGIAGKSAAGYVNFLVDLDIAVKSGGQVQLKQPIDNIGPTLEWYVADLCEREFEGSAEWSVDLAGCQYGDYDVLAWLPPSLVYIEVKSSKPSEVTDVHLRHFLQRGMDLVPEMAVMLIDTEDDLEETGLLGRLFEVMLEPVRLASGIQDAAWRPKRPFIAPQSGYQGVSFGYFRFYVINSKPSISVQLQRCLAHYHKNVKGHTFLRGKTINFVTGEVEGDY